MNKLRPADKRLQRNRHNSELRRRRIKCERRFLEAYVALQGSITKKGGFESKLTATQEAFLRQQRNQ